MVGDTVLAGVVGEGAQALGLVDEQVLGGEQQDRRKART